MKRRKRKRRGRERETREREREKERERERKKISYPLGLEELHASRVRHLRGRRGKKRRNEKTFTTLHLHAPHRRRTFCE